MDVHLNLNPLLFLFFINDMPVCANIIYWQCSRVTNVFNKLSILMDVYLYRRNFVDGPNTGNLILILKNIWLFLFPNSI